MTQALEAFAETIRAAATSATPLRLRGGGTKDFYGQSLAGEVLDTRAYAGIVEYDPTELFITARCGTPLAEVEQAMHAKGQMLAFEPPGYGAAATIGGVVSAGLAGPRRATVGGIRDFVLGARVLDGRGADLRFGGKVMKNVAGYDVSRLMAGALGTLGVLTEVTLKALPLPVAEATLRLEAPPERALALLNQWGGKPLPISASCHENDQLTIRLSGARAAVSAARVKLGGETVPEAEIFWASVREHVHLFFSSGLPLWRLSVPSVAPPLALPGSELIEWGGSLRWLVSNADARTIRAAVARVGGHATLFAHGDKSVGVFQPLPEALAKIHRGVKEALDPQRIFNRGRMYADL